MWNGFIISYKRKSWRLSAHSANNIRA
ncbi:UNVERIFIED_CONTAM: hypothetical protein GTU68_006181 [Idotea baltica]|nr:hypothetical protein [Idotea baltica]